MKLFAVKLLIAKQIINRFSLDSCKFLQRKEIVNLKEVRTFFFVYFSASFYLFRKKVLKSFRSFLINF